VRVHTFIHCLIPVSTIILLLMRGGFDHRLWSQRHIDNKMKLKMKMKLKSPTERTAMMFPLAVFTISTLTTLTTLLLQGLSSDANIIEIFATDHFSRYIHNVSYGLQYDLEAYGHQCSASGSKRLKHENGKMDYMTYTPNRRSQDETIEDGNHQALQLGIVLAVGAHGDSYYDYGPSGSLNGLMSVWDSWMDNFLPVVSNSTSLIILFDERDFFKQNYTKSVDSYLDAIVIGNMGGKAADCVAVKNSRPLHPSVTSHRGGAISSNHHGHAHHRNHLHNQPHHSRFAPAGCVGNHLDLDSGYKVYYFDVGNSSLAHYQSPFLVFASVYKFPAPEWAQGTDEESLFKTWKPRGLPGRFKTNYGYVKMTNWYAYHQLNLKLLDYFDYAGKLDNDVSFVAPFPESNLPLRLAAKGIKMMATQQKWYYDDPRIANGIRQCLNNYVSEESKRCSSDIKDKATKSLTPGGIQANLFWESNLNATFRSHFLVYWLGLYSAPEVHHLARHWNDWNPRGMWDYRWGDQQWWPRPLSMFSHGDIDRDIERYDTINTDNERYVVHKLWPRQWTVEKTRYFNLSGSTRSVRDALFTEAAKAFK
jgi:hypothetical protein